MSTNDKMWNLIALSGWEEDEELCSGNINEAATQPKWFRKWPISRSHGNLGGTANLRRDLDRTEPHAVTFFGGPVSVKL
ncbi:MAG TPA: hypothetical protein VGX71_10385 [Pseudaminobacter sp.]|nr:hypothetical protein [Pseudaminobacter sp.]